MHHNCCDVLCSWILPRAREAVCEHYRTFLTCKPRLEVWCVKLVNISYAPSECPVYVLDFELYPYVGPKFNFAVCHLRVTVNKFDGAVCVKLFRQLRSYPVPRELWDLVNQPF